MRELEGAITQSPAGSPQVTVAPTTRRSPPDPLSSADSAGCPTVFLGECRTSQIRFFVTVCPFTPWMKAILDALDLPTSAGQSSPKTANFATACQLPRDLTHSTPSTP